MTSRDEFFGDPRNLFAAELCLRRALEALFDLGRHILVKGFALGVSEYKEIARALHQNGVINAEESALLNILAGYRNRLVHFYHEVSPEELYEICTHQLGDITRIASALQKWINAHPENLDEGI
ncbi:DUF86 domain-containing protein [uncultured Thermanaerothrix sp.]|uniref:type VII toxin-antitoxin system HepT family RNase toxin n=1 Tax=uncultured Thermanaerothrix sp. TaxID=1195149 RepID=UPI0026097435|nr:DUF86 domain-containing protein [uncultured Thermanaerothrix sp.]